MKEKLKPIIKWTGGKYNEFALFASEIPTFERYIEPFFGGGGVFFALQPKVCALINDKSADLINFYKAVGQPAFNRELLTYANVWDELSILNQTLWSTCGELFTSVVNGENELDLFIDCLEKHFFNLIAEIQLLTDEGFLIDVNKFNQALLASILDKTKRIKRICERENRVFKESELRNHFETGIRSGAYLFFREILNKNWSGKVVLDPYRAAANWYFVREFCYGSMFRFNSKGEFNIPYGGITYNRKNFRQKIEKISSLQVQALFKDVTISNLDFEAFLKQIDLNKHDFIFLDPPYDSEFSAYDQSSFNQKDQLRLANLLIGIKAKWMVVIKETPFIRQIYTNPGVKIKTFSKNYTYNMRGRNNRGVQHLIITNF
jgi:DNA adenine methylase